MNIEPEFFGANWYIAGDFSKFVPLDALKHYSQVLPVLRFLCNSFPKLIRFTFETLFFMDVLKSSCI